MATEENVSAPVVIELGGQRRKRIKQLKQGRGPLIAEVAEAVEQVKSGLGTEAAGKHFLPVVMVYRKKGRRRGGYFPFF